jgi:hypothetical protein
MRKLSLALLLLLLAGNVGAKTFYLDVNLSATCSGNYSIASRTCSGSDGDAYQTLQGAINALASGDTLYIREGNYTRDGDGVNYGSNPTGSLAISVASTVSNYGTEQPVIYTQTGKMNYNPNPGDTGYTGSSHYYPWPAISIHAAGVTVRGLKTYGQVAILNANAIVENCDIGGGGSALNQGQVVYLNYGSGSIIRNNLIHNSCWGESSINGSALQIYNTGNLIVEKNTFYNNWGSDFRAKDTHYSSGISTSMQSTELMSTRIFSTRSLLGRCSYWLPLTECTCTTIRS